VHTLHLLRHAKSSWSDPTLSDHQRPLARRGQRDAKRIAKHLVRVGIEPELVLCSTAVRARETLELIRAGLGAAPKVSFEAELYAASSRELLERIHTVPDEVTSLMLIGHNPSLQDLALALSSGGPELARIRAKFPTAALATMTLPTSWSLVSDADAVLAAYVVPKELD
jgi:phosphohistidine phosphatase